MNNKKTSNVRFIRKIIFVAIFLFCLIFAISSFRSNITNNINNTEVTTEESIIVEEDKEYGSYKEVAAYIHTFKKLPSNYLTKNEAHQKGWDDGNPQYDIEGNVYIGGDSFKNLEQLLPINEEYYECDVDYVDEKRSQSRLIYTKDGKVYYTNDHYESFTRLY